VEFSYRGDEVAAQAATGAIRYDIACDPVRGRWYLDASWKAAPAPGAPLDELRQHPVVAVDVNVAHLAVAVLAADGNVLGTPAAIPLDLAGLPSATRDGRLRAAISSLIGTAKEHGAQAVVIEDLDFAGARSEGRERHGNRPSRGRRGRGLRPRTTPAARPAPTKPATPRDPRQPPGTKTRRPHRIMAGNQAAQDRPGPPASQDCLLLAQQERFLVCPFSS
jgi:hypothetical protein